MYLKYILSTFKHDLKRASACVERFAVYYGVYGGGSGSAAIGGSIFLLV